MFTYLNISNFRSIKGAISVPLTGHGLMLLNGEISGIEGADSNGAGKSSLFGALIYALYDYNPHGAIGDVVNSNSDACRVEVQWKQGGRDYSVVRSRTAKGSAKCLFLENGNPRGDDKNAKAVNSDILQVLGVSRETFMLTLMSDGETTFAEMTDSQQKAVLDGLLSINLGDFSSKAKVKETSCQQQLQALAVERAQAESVATVAASMVEHAQAQVQQATEAYNKVVAEDWRPKAKEQYTKIDVERQDIEKHLRRISESAGQQVATCSNNCRWLDDWYANYTEFCAQLNTHILQERQAEETRYAAFVANSTKCTYCDRQHDTVSQQFYLRGEKSRSETVLHRLEERKANFTRKLEALYVDVVSNRGVITHEQWVSGDWSQTKQKYENALSAAKNVVVDPALRERSYALSKQSADIQQQVAVYTNVIENAAATVRRAQTDLQALVQKQQAAAKRPLAEIDADTATIRQRLIVAQHVLAALQKNGLAAYIMELQLPSIEAIANDYLRVLSPSALHITLGIKREEGKFDGNLLLTAHNRYGATSYPGLSKGERERVNIALLLALRTIVVSNHFNPGVLFLDELIDGLDQTGIENVISLLQGLAQDTQIVVTSHNKALKALFPDVLTIQRNQHGDTVLDTSQLIHYSVTHG